MAEQPEILQRAVERNTPVVLSLPSAGLMRQYRSRLLAMSDGQLFLETTEEQAATVDYLIGAGQSAIVTFRNDTHNVEFSGRILERLPLFELNSETRLPAIRMPQPEPTAIKIVQRRSDYRVSVPQDSDFAFRFWRIGEHDDLINKPASTALMNIDVRDFSAGGIGGTWMRRPEEPTSLAANQRLRIEITAPSGTTIVDARIRFAVPLPNSDNQRLGIQFVLAPNNLQDRQKVAVLTKLVGELQRLELRRKKLAR